MRYSVEITEPAQLNIQEAYDWLHAESATAAVEWIDGLLETIEKLGTFPLRCPLAPESVDHREKIRETFFGSYRILFVVRKGAVYVLHVRHGSRDRARREDILRQ